MSRVTRLLYALLTGLSVGFVGQAAAPGDAEAQIYKYTRKDGVVVYTDSLAELPMDRRKYYNQIDAQRREEEARLEAKLGTEEYQQRKEAERLKKDEAEAQEIREADERAAALAKIADARRALTRGASQIKAVHAARYRQAVASLRGLLADYRAAQASYESLAMKAPQTLLPGEAGSRETYRKQMAALEAVIDEQIKMVTQTLPREALKAGVSLRDVMAESDLGSLTRPSRGPADSDDRGEAAEPDDSRGVRKNEVDEGREATVDLGSEGYSE
ncbi:MAG: DUF4124 domain-containing protein [Deltaproteobacteria bacterium]|nr:DUF4124 domain-containing protein [Deltaproteobacteria bacterium]